MDGPVGAAPLSACNAKTKAAVRIGVHLNIYGIRHNRLFQVIDVVSQPFRRLFGGSHRGPFVVCCARIPAAA